MKDGLGGGGRLRQHVKIAVLECGGRSPGSSLKYIVRSTQCKCDFQSNKNSPQGPSVCACVIGNIAVDGSTVCSQ